MTVYISLLVNTLGQLLAERDASRPQLDFPQLVADLIRELRLTGQLGILEMSDQVIPTINVGNVRPTEITVNPPTFDSAEIFSGAVATPNINSVIVDTGQLPEGIYDVLMGLSVNQPSTGSDLDFQWRDAANAATLADWPTKIGTTVPVPDNGPRFIFSLNIALNERLRLFNSTNQTTGGISGWIMAAKRPTP